MKTVIITGGNRGIGLAITKQLLFEGYRVICFHRDKAQKRNVLSDGYEESYGDIKYTSHWLDFRHFVEVKLEVESVYAIINCAGIAHAKPFEEITEEEWDEMMAVNVKGAFLGVKIFNDMIEDEGRIVNISSVSGLQGMSGHAHYCASKFALQGLTQVLAKELKGRKITVNTVNPGPTETDMWEQLDKDYSKINHWDESMKQEDKYFSKLLIKRMGKPEDVANTVSFLLKPESDYITGISLKVCGGNLIG